MHVKYSIMKFAKGIPGKYTIVSQKLRPSIGFESLPIVINWGAW